MQPKNIPLVISNIKRLEEVIITAEESLEEVINSVGDVAGIENKLEMTMWRYCGFKQRR